MNALEILVVLFVLRLVVPLGVLLWLGENARRRQSTNYRRISGGL
jgi:hypothetical protein